MSKYNLIRGEAFIYGECIFVIEDSGFTNVEQVITRLLSSLHEDVPRPTKVQNKPAAAVAICRRGGATAAYQTMNMIFEMMNMPVVTSQYWNIAYGLAPGEVIQDTEGMQTMRTLADNMAWLLKKIHANGNPDYPEREEWQGMNFIR